MWVEGVGIVHVPKVLRHFLPVYWANIWMLGLYKSYLTGDRWQVTGDRWQVTGDSWHMTTFLAFNIVAAICKCKEIQCVLHAEFSLKSALETKLCCIQFSRNFFGPILPLFWTPYKKIVILLQATKIFLNLFSMTIFTGKHLIHYQFGEKCNIVSLLFSFYLI